MNDWDPEVGWSSSGTATGFLLRPYPRVYDLDVVLLSWGVQGTVIDRRGPWLEVECGPVGDPVFVETRIDNVTVVWSR